MSDISDPTVARLGKLLRAPVEVSGRYQLEAEIGRGGMGVVWRATDKLLEREVALKILAEHITEAGIAERLRREAKILAHLDHPGIVAIHDVGELDDGRTWYTMRLVRGKVLSEVIAEGQSVGDSVRIMVRLAEAIGFANSAGVIHRDLKPQNVMLGPFGEVLVLDWGVARVVEGEGPTKHPPGSRSTQFSEMGEQLTGHGAILGTPGYMAPEQSAGLLADERSDVYGLGGIFRELLGGSTDGVPKSLRAINDRALDSVPSARYSTALEFREDLLRYQDGLSVSAYREGPLELVERFVRKHRFLLLLVSAYLVMRLLVLVWRGI